MRTRSRAQAAAALVLTALLGVPDLLLSPSPGPRTDTAYTSTSTTGMQADTTEDTAVTFRGLVFDLCEAPPLAVMSAWRKSSPYGAVGVPYAGRGGECPGRSRPTRSWVAEVHRMGWRLLPLFTGAQPPCAKPLADGPPVAAAGREGAVVREGVIGRAPVAQGQEEGSEAVRAAHALGMTRGSALYVSLKSYDLDDPSCVRTTLDYIRAWNREVRRHGYVPGLRSHADAGVLHMEHARRAGTGDLPSAMWFARWNHRPSLYEERALHPYAWRVKRRIHQYEGEVTEEYGGHRLTVGRSLADAPVARIRR